MIRFNWLKPFLAAAMMSAAFGVFAQGNDVVPMNPPQPTENDGKIEVLEFFSYACPHCATLDPSLETWAKRQPVDVKFKRVPVDGINGFNGAAALFYALEAMGQLDRLHTKIFDAFHVEHVILANPATLNKWLEKNGVDPKKFEEVLKSFSVSTKVQRARKMNLDYKIESVPTLVVNGRFKVAQTSGPERLLGFVDQLIGQARAASTPAAAVKAAVPKK